MRAAALTLLVLAGCQTMPDLPPPPKVVEVVVQKTVNWPKELRTLCDTHPKQDQTVGEAVRLANSRLASVVLCNCKILRGTQLTEKLPPEHEKLLAECPKTIREAKP